MTNYTDFLSQVFLFKNVKMATLTKIVQNLKTEIKCYEAKATIYSPEDYEPKLGFVLNGECSVNRLKSDGGCVPLNRIGKGGSFGIMAVLTDVDEFPTLISATKATKILFIDKSDALKAIRKYPSVANNVIDFLAKKIIFLNGKVATFSADSVEDKLAGLILAESRRLGTDSFKINCKRSAETINAGRASLYRALSSLSDSGLIRFENKIVYIIDREGLERNTK